VSLFSLDDSPLATLEADVLVVGVVPAESGAALAEGHGLPEQTAAHLTAVLPSLGATGKVDDVHTVPLVPGIAATKVVITGLAPALGKDQSVTEFSVRAGAGAALRQIGAAGRVVVALPARETSWVGAAALGAHLGSYAFTAFKSDRETAKGGGKDAAPKPGPAGRRVTTLVVHVDDADAPAKASIARAEVVAEATAWVRDLVNTPPNVLYPESFVDAVRDQIKSNHVKLDVAVHDHKALAEMGCGGIVGVGQGSSRGPRIMELHHRPRHAAAHVAYVGKGITFDTGGLCLKPSAAMLGMKSDMAGAAAVAAAVIAAARLKLPVAVSGYLCLAENMPSSTAQRPSDVVTMRNGTTVEIIDTDAEGRMVLGDGLCLAVESGADAILDIATLTGACIIALGPRVAGVMSNDEDVNTRVFAAANAAGEAMWPLPLPEDLRPKLDSQVADLQHKGDLWGGTLTAGLFLREFVARSEGDPVPWAHLDIAGPSFNETAPYGSTPKGGTGFGMATLLAFAEQAGGHR
jgi:leucyl aminopeptidase